jgi:hypothetical protein
MGLISLGLDIGIFCNLLYSVLLLNVILGLDFLGLALSASRRPGRARTAEFLVEGEAVGEAQGLEHLEELRPEDLNENCTGLAQIMGQL